MTAPERLPFAFARDEQVVLDGRAVLLGPGFTQTGLREAQRRAGPDARLSIESDEGFDAALARVYQSRDDTETDDGPVFDLEGAAASGPRDLLEDVEEAPVIRLVNMLLLRAVQAGASDLHVEPVEGGLRVRQRIDGFLQPVMLRSDVPVKRIVSRLKVMAGLDIAETRLPQDGRIPLTLGGRTIDTRVSSLPGHYGERIVLRILDRSSGLRPLDQLGLSPAQIALLERLSAMPNGIILATGPTGAGKTTTLYSLLQLADRDERNIVTVEDPIEYDLPGISQSQINAEIGMTFAAGLRATLRQDPDVILVGEIRDGETAGVAAQAALTGHLVFSSLHANGAAGAVVRLRDLGVQDFLIAATLRGVIAQRLLRRLCLDCRRPRQPSDDEAAAFRRHRLEVPPAVFDAVGCKACNGSGYSGRVGVFEMIEVGDALRAAIERGANESELTAQALDARETLAGQGLGEAAAGRTTVAEVLRVVGDVA
ncbi:GspE/PulE family protein [Jannaschia seohaensis]|uniref:General secretion pathway protein E n=1 Tax=Jannaschia seohaensis TaxID=475081 RepID=A0A2Y9AZ85_9RHOB|nr:ATPase, T2SS/T4P/T4SS family [Jannaschia seohaensis]PWJ15801.1 general secretion pathway protein E [Jannaschia seohaensis]SSA49491.1 general secretion pathway protein E [Jannaschia seohaensis]